MEKERIKGERKRDNKVEIFKRKRDNKSDKWKRKKAEEREKKRERYGMKEK